MIERDTPPQSVDDALTQLLEVATTLDASQQPSLAAAITDSVDVLDEAHEAHVLGTSDDCRVDPAELIRAFAAEADERLREGDAHTQYEAVGDTIEATQPIWRSLPFQDLLALLDWCTAQYDIATAFEPEQAREAPYAESDWREAVRTGFAWQLLAAAVRAELGRENCKRFPAAAPESEPMAPLVTRLPDGPLVEDLLQCPDCDAVVTGEMIRSGPQEEPTVSIDEDDTIRVPFECQGCEAALELRVSKPLSRTDNSALGVGRR